jgi:hypothetical protein
MGGWLTEPPKIKLWRVLAWLAVAAVLLTVWWLLRGR